MFVVVRIRANRHPDPRTEFPHQLRQQFWITGMETPKVDAICNLSAPSPVGWSVGLPTVILLLLAGRFRPVPR